MGTSSRQSQRGIPSFENQLENEEEVLDAFLNALAKNQLDPDLWEALQQAAVRDDRTSQLAFAFESLASSRKLKTFLPAVQAEIYFRAARYFAEILGDAFGGSTYLEKAIAAFPAHTGAFETLDAQLTQAGDNKKLAELCAQCAPHRQRHEQLLLLKRAAVLYEHANLDDKAIETFQLIVRLDPHDEAMRNALEARYVKANRFRDVARLLEQALATNPAPEIDEQGRIRAKLIDVFASQLKEPERAMPHIEAVIEIDPTYAPARAVAHQLLQSKGLAARAAAALGAGAESTEERSQYLAIELEHTRGPKRRDVLRKIGVLKQDELGDTQGAFEAFEQALGIDPGDDELRRRYVELGTQLKGALEVARTYARVSTVAKDAAVRSKITAEMGELLLRGGDVKRARTTLAGVLAAASADPQAILVAARALAGLYEGEGDAKNLADVLSRVGELSPDDHERQAANERVAEICSTELDDLPRAIAAWRRLVDSPARADALTALEPLYEQRSEWIDLSFVLEERAKDTRDTNAARQLFYRAADVLAKKAKDAASASEAWRRMIAAYGPARDVYAQWIPLLEEQKAWPDLASALSADAGLAPADERPQILARLGTVHLQRTKDVDAAIEAFRRALTIDPNEKTSRATLEKLLSSNDQRVAAAAVLEPIYRTEGNAQGLLRVLDIRAQGEPIVQDRLAALEEAAEVAIHVSRDKAVEIVARGLGEAVESAEQIAPWLSRFDFAAEGLDAKKRAALLGRALAEREVTTPELSTLAQRVGQECAAAGDVAGALAAYRRALAFEPTSPELLSKVDALLKEGGNPEERVALYRAALERGPAPDRRRQLLHSIGSIERYELANPDGAVMAYKRALKDDPKDLEAHGALVELYEETEAWEDLCNVLDEHLQHAASPEEARATRAKLAEVAATHGQGARAALHAGALVADRALTAADLDVVERVAELLSDRPLLRAALERRARESADPKLQVATLERLAKLAHSEGDRAGAVQKFRQAAELARGASDEATAIAMLTRLRGIEPRDVVATAQLVELYERAEEFAKVPDLYAVLLDLAPDDDLRVALRRRLARVLADRLDDAARAFDAVRGAFALRPTDRSVLGELVDLATRAGKTSEFAETIGRVLATPGLPTSATMELTLAKARVLATTKATFADAAASYRIVVEHAEEDRQIESAELGFETLLRTMPASDERTADMRWLYGLRASRAKAEERARATFLWAKAEEEILGDEAAALALYRRVLELDEPNLEALAAVARLSLAQGDVEGALAALESRKSVSEGAAQIALDVQIAGILAERSGRSGEAMDRLAEVFAKAPHDQEALALASRLLKNDTLAARAAALLEKSIDAVEDPNVRVDILRRLIDSGEPRLDLHERLVALLEELDRPGEAHEAVLAAARALPTEPKVWDRAEELARKVASPDTLAAVYEEVLARALPKDQAIELGQRAVAFYEEWYEDGSRVVGILERLLEVDPEDSWAFDRLKLIFDAQERWDDLFALYDRAGKVATRERRIELLEEAAQIAKDFANHSARAIGYLEQLLELRPGNARLSAQLERLYERHGCHRELIILLGARLPTLPPEEAQKERARIALLWLDEIDDPSSALIVADDIIAHELEGEPAALDVTDLLERILGAAPHTADIKESIPPPPEGRRDSYIPLPPKRGLVRQRAAALLKERYSVAGKEADLARVLEVELEAVKSVKERIRRHQQIAGIYTSLGNDEAAMEHLVSLVLLEPEVEAHRTELTTLASRIGRYDRLADVLVTAADDTNDDRLRIDLLMHAGQVTAEKIGDGGRAILLFFRILRTSPIADSAALEACRNVEPLLAAAGRKADRLDVLERLAILDTDERTRWEVLGEAARLAMDLEEDDRAIWAWEGRLETWPEDPEALDGLAFLFEKAERWRPLMEILARRGRLEDRSPEQRRSDRVRGAQIQSEKLEAVEEAIETWRDVEATFGENEESTRALSALYRLTKRWEDLARLLGRTAERAASSEERADLYRELGDVQREQLDAVDSAITSYESALREDPRTEGARSGLRALLKRPEHRADVVRVLLVAYYGADDWRLVLDLTEHRLNAAKDTTAQVAILMEASKLAETRAQDNDAAFGHARRALLLDPSIEETVAELFRLAEVTGAHRGLADALDEAVASNEDAPWARSLRFRMGGVLETKIDDANAALDAFVVVAAQDPSDLDAVKAVVRTSAKTGRWDAAAIAFVDATRARETLETEIVEAIEDAAITHGGWDALTTAAARSIDDGGELPPALARDVEAQIATWHRDRRGDPDSAEAAYQRALGHDPSNPDILAELAKLQRRARGRPLVESLLRLSQSTGGDLDLLTEAAETAFASVGDRALARSIFERLLKLSAERWLGATFPNVSSGTPKEPQFYVERAVRELVKIHGDDGDHEKVAALLIDTAKMPWRGDEPRRFRHDAARVAVEKLNAVDRAIEIYLELIEDDPHDGEAVKRLVALYETHQRRLELLALKRKLVSVAKTDDERLTLRLEVARLEDGLEEPERAIATLRENLGESPRHEETVRELVAILSRDAKSGDLESVLSEQARLADEAGDRPLAADLYGRAADVAETALKDLARAIAHLKKVVEIDPRPAALDALARLSSALKDHEAAAGYLDRLRELAPTDGRADVTLRLADALAQAGRKPEARERLESEIARDPSIDRVRIRLAEMLRKSEDWASLAAVLADGATHAPDKTTRLARLREAAELHRVKTGDPNAAIPLLEQAVDLAPDDNTVKLALANALGTAGRYEEARAHLKTLIDAFGGRRPKERGPVHYQIARLDLALGDRARALLELDAATKIDPSNPEILRTLAELARDDGQLERAERSYRALLTALRRQEDTPEDAPITKTEVFFELSRIAIRQGEKDRAQEILESAFEIATENVVEAQRLEGQLRKIGDHAGLARALEGRLQRGHAPDVSAVYAELGRLYDEHLGRAEDAFEMRLRALDADPLATDVHVAAERLAGSLGRMADYESRIRAIADKRSDDAEIVSLLYARLAVVAERDRKDDREAASLYERAVESRPRDKELLEALDRIYERLGDDAGQARLLGMRVALDAEAGGAPADALYRLAQLRFRSGEPDGACDAFEEAYAAAPDLPRGLELFASASETHAANERVVTTYERLARESGDERKIVDALQKRFSLPGFSTTEPMREAVAIAEKLEDKELVEHLLRRYLEGDHEDREGRIWGLSLLAWKCEEAGNVREAILLKREAAEIAEPTEARRFLFEVAGLASGPLGDLGLAGTIYEELHEREPQDRDAWELLLDVYRRTNQYDKLTGLIQEIGGYVDTPADRSKLRFERVRISMEKLRLSDDDAIVELREIVDDDPGAVDAAILLVTLLERNGREGDLVDLLRRQLDAAKDRSDGDAVSSLSKRLGELLEKADRNAAKEIYYAALDWDPRARDIMLALERMHDEDAEIEQRSDIMEKRLPLEHGDSAESLALDLAETRRALEDAAGALRALEVGFAAAPKSAQLRERLEASYKDQLEYEKLAHLYVNDARVRESSKEKSVRLREAALIFRDELSDPEQGAKILREAREAEPTDPILLGELVDMLTASGELKAAASELTSAIDLLPEGDALRTDLVGRRAILKSRLNDGEGALADFKAAIAAGKVELRAYLAEHLAKMAMHAAGRNDVAQWRAHRLEIAELRLAMNDVEEARNVLNELLKADSKDRATLRSVAHLDELQQDWAAASATYRRLVGLEEGDALVSAALKLADTAEKAGRPADARGGLERARAAAPGNADLRKRLAALYELLGATRELAELVLEEARAATDVGPRFEGLLRAGHLFLEVTADPSSTAEVGGSSSAVAALQEAHALRPNDLDCAALLSDALVGAGQLDDAQEILSRTIASFKGRRARELSAMYHRIARIAEMLGDKQAELQSLVTALDMDTQNGAVASELAYLAMELENYEVAQRALRQITMLKVPAPLPKALAYQHLGEIARHQGDNKRALMLLKRATDEDPQLETARELLSQIQAEM